MKLLTSPAQAELLEKLFKMSEDFRPTELALLQNLNERKYCYQFDDLNSYFLLAVIYHNVGRFEESVEIVNMLRDCNTPTSAEFKELNDLYSRIEDFQDQLKNLKTF
jgi:hypothetical protein